MPESMSIEKVKQLLTDGKSEAAADMLLNYVHETHSKHYEAALLLKNRIENVQQQEIEGIISQADKNIEWAKISKSVLTLALKIEREEAHLLETGHNGKTFVPTVSVDFPFTKVLIPLVLVAIPLLLYFFLPRPRAPKTINLEIQAFKNDGNTVFTEGGKVKVIWDNKDQNEVPIMASGKGYLTNVPINILEKSLQFQWLDSQYFNLIKTDISQIKENKTVQLFLEVKKTLYKGKIVNPDDEPVENVVVDFGNGIARDTSDAQGNYTVYLPINIGDRIVVHLSKNKEFRFEQRIRIDKSVLNDLAAPRNTK